MEVYDVMNPHCIKQIFPIPWHFIKLRFHCTVFFINLKHMAGTFDP